MNTKLLIKPCIALALCVLCTAAYAITPSLNIDQEISFGQVMFTQGNCTMSHIDGEFSNTSPQNKCGGYGRGTPGRYVIIANPNKQIRIQLLQLSDLGNGYLFTPSGELVSDTETLTITPGIAQDIDSGTSGVVRINVGGSFFWSIQNTPNAVVNLIREDGIEWSELP